MAAAGKNSSLPRKNEGEIRMNTKKLKHAVAACLTAGAVAFLPAPKAEAVDLGGVFDVLHAYQKRGELKAYSDLGLAAVLFAPVQFLARSSDCVQSAQMQLDELVAMLQDLLLIR